MGRAVVVVFTNTDGSTPPRAMGPYSNINVGSLFVCAAGMDDDVSRVASRDAEGRWHIDDGLDDGTTFGTLVVLAVSERVSLRKVERLLARVARRLKDRRREGG